QRNSLRNTGKPWSKRELFIQTLAGRTSLQLPYSRSGASGGLQVACVLLDASANDFQLATGIRSLHNVSGAELNHLSLPGFAEATMVKVTGDFTEILVKKQIVSPDQIEEARVLQNQTGAKLQETIVKLGYATMDDVMGAIAEYHGLQIVDLT